MRGQILDEICAGGFSFPRLEENHPELSALREIPQNPAYHGEGDVFRHTEMVCETLTSLCDWQQLALQDRALLFLAAAYHDLGKAVCTRWEEGNWVSPRHTRIGEGCFRRKAFREAGSFGLTFWQRELVAGLIRSHGLPVWFFTKENPEYALLQAAESIPLRFLYLLSAADVAGRITVQSDELSDRTGLFADYAKELGVWDAPFSFANPCTRFRYYQKRDLPMCACFYDDTEFDVILLSGLPLSGKDTWIANYGTGRPVVSLDEIREEMKLPPTRDTGRVVQRAMEQARSYLRRKESFIWNATNLIRETRQKLVRLFAGYGARVHIVYMETPYEELLRRNQIRARQIPEHVLETMIRKLELPAPWEAWDVTYEDGMSIHNRKGSF